MALTAALDKSLPAYSSALNSRLYTGSTEKAARNGDGDSGGGGQIYQRNLLTRINTNSPTSKAVLSHFGHHFISGDGVSEEKLGKKKSSLQTGKTQVDS